MSNTDFQTYLDVAISVLSQKESISIRKLKDFLQALPNPKQVEQTLGSAVLHFARNDASVFEWVIANQNLLEPELNLVNFTRRLMIRRVRDRGDLQDSEISTDLRVPLQLTPKTLAALSHCLEAGELQLVKAVLVDTQSH